MKLIKLMFAMWLGLLALSPMVEAEDSQECAAAEEAAQKAYDRTVDSYNSGDTAHATWYSHSFSEIYQRNQDCQFIKELADKLSAAGITNTAVVQNSSHVDLGDLMKRCPQCKVVIEKDGGAITAGHGTQKID
jgi:hypothetical protein